MDRNKGDQMATDKGASEHDLVVHPRPEELDRFQVVARVGDEGSDGCLRRNGD